MKRSLTKKIVLALSAAVMAGSFTGCAGNSSKGDTIDLQIMATSDVHNYLMDYDYYTNSETKDSGLVKISTVINKYREDSKEKNKSDVDNILVVDNGDLIQGNPLGDYFSKVSPVEKGTEHPVYKALNIAGYDVGTLGNHEFNFGLDYLNQILSDSKVSIVNANVYNAQTGEPEFKQYDIVTKKVVDNNGKEEEIKIGVTGFVPPQILNWDKNNLEGKVTVKDIKESAEEIVPKMKEAGADLVVVLSHSGLGDGNYKVGNEDETYDLTSIKGIDAIVGGHSHETFPIENYDISKFENVDLAKGTINGIPVVQPAKYSEGVGVIDLTIEKDGDSYKVKNSSSKFVDLKGVENDQKMVDALAEDHQAVIDYVNSPVGKSESDINTYFSLVADNNATQIISDAQIEYGKKKIAEEATLSQYKDLPILSAAAPFKAGLAEDGIKAKDYIDLKPGDLSTKDISNVYKYANTVTLVKVNGAALRDWLDMSAVLYNKIDANSTEAQDVINLGGRSYNFDSIDGVTYGIDVTKDAKFDLDGNKVSDISRIVDLKYNGTEVKDTDEFVVVTNNYRASGGGNFKMITEDNIIYNSSDETRQAINEYVKSKGTINVKADNNWSIQVPANVKLSFISNANGANYLKDYPSISKVEDMENDLAKYVMAK